QAACRNRTANATHTDSTGLRPIAQINLFSFFVACVPVEVLAGPVTDWHRITNEPRKPASYERRRKSGVSMRAVVIGCGIGGAAAALALAEIGVEVEIYEAAARSADHGGWVTLGPAADDRARSRRCRGRRLGGRFPRGQRAHC